MPSDNRPAAARASSITSQQQQHQQQQVTESGRDDEQLAVATYNKRPPSGSKESTATTTTSDNNNNAKIDFSQVVPLSPPPAPPGQLHNLQELAPVQDTQAIQVAAGGGKRRKSSARLFFNPPDAFCHWWSGVVSLAFLYNFWSLSYRFAFKEIDSSTVTVWFLLDYTADFIYLNDIWVNFRTGHLEDGVLQRDPNKIGLHYRESTLFYLDTLCLLPFDFLYLSFGYCSIMRCNKLVKIYKFWSFVDRTERHTNYPNVFRTFTLVHYILVIFHWNACLFHMISKHKIIDIESLYKINDNQCDDISCQYLHAFYWSTLALTLIGDLPRPRTRGEFIYVIVELCFGLFLFASVLGHVANIVTNVSAARKEFQAKLDAVKTFMRTRRVSEDLQNKVIRWFDYLWMSQKSSDEEKSVACLPDRLKAEIAIHVNLDTLKRVDIFQNTEAGFLCELVLRLKPVLFSPGDYVCRKNEVGHEMYIVSRGILEVVTNDGQTVVATFRAGSYFGEIAVLNVGSAGNKRTASVRSVGYSDLFCLSKQDLWDVLKDYPNAEARIRAVAEERLSMLGGGGGGSGAPPPPAADKKSGNGITTVARSDNYGTNNDSSSNSRHHYHHHHNQRLTATASTTGGAKRPQTIGGGSKRQAVAPSVSCAASFKHSVAANCSSDDHLVAVASSQRHRNCSSARSGDGHRHRVGSSSSACRYRPTTTQAESAPQRYQLEPCHAHQCPNCSHSLPVSATGTHPLACHPVQKQSQCKPMVQHSARCLHCDPRPEWDRDDSRESRDRQRYLLPPPGQADMRAGDSARRDQLSPIDFGTHLHAPSAFSSSSTTSHHFHGADGAWPYSYNNHERPSAKDSKSYECARRARACELDHHKCLGSEEQRRHYAHPHSPVSLTAPGPDRRRSRASARSSQVGQPLDGASVDSAATLSGNSFRVPSNRSPPGIGGKNRDELTTTVSVYEPLDEQAQLYPGNLSDRLLERRCSSLVQVPSEDLVVAIGGLEHQCRHHHQPHRADSRPLSAINHHNYDLNVCKQNNCVMGSTAEELAGGEESLRQRPETIGPLEPNSGATGSSSSSSSAGVTHSEATLGALTNRRRAQMVAAARDNGGHRVKAERNQRQEQSDWASSDTNSLGSFVAPDAGGGQLGDNNVALHSGGQQSSVTTSGRPVAARSINSLDFEPIEPRRGRSGSHRMSGGDAEHDTDEFRIDIGDK